MSQGSLQGTKLTTGIADFKEHTYSYSPLGTAFPSPRRQPSSCMVNPFILLPPPWKCTCLTEYMRICIRKTHICIYIYSMCMYIFGQPTVMVLISLPSFLSLPPCPLPYFGEPHRAAKPRRSSIWGRSLRSLGAAVFHNPTSLCSGYTWDGHKRLRKTCVFPKETHVRRSLQRPSWAWGSPGLQVWFSCFFA